jgi:thiamine pyridinylase
MRLALLPTLGLAVGPLLLGGILGGALAADARTELRVGLYEYVPGYGEGDTLADFRQCVIEQFEKENQDIDLVLPKSSDAYSSYNPDDVKAWLGDGKDGERYDLVEIDTLLLGDVISAAQPWDLDDRSDYIDAGLAAGTIDQKLYAVPHLLCSHFLFGRDSDLDD